MDHKETLKVTVAAQPRVESSEFSGFTLSSYKLLLLEKNLLLREVPAWHKGDPS
jgi:hypothetical protein